MKNLSPKERSGKPLVFLIFLYLASFLLPYYQIMVITPGYRVVCCQLFPNRELIQSLQGAYPWYVVESMSLPLLIFSISLMLAIASRKERPRVALWLNVLATVSGFYWSIGTVIIGYLSSPKPQVYFALYGWGYYLSTVLGFLLIVWLFRDIVYRNRMNGNKNGAFKFSLTAK